MGSCLGVYLGDKIIKFAKLIQDDKTKRISLDSYGTKYMSDNDESAILEIINQTGSQNLPLSINIKNYHRTQAELLKQLSKGDMQNVLELEMVDYASNNSLNEKTIEHREILMDSQNSNDNYTADIAITEKGNINKYQENEMFSKLVGLYPTEYILKNLVQNSSNYIILNVDEKTQLISVVGGKINRLIDLDLSMSDILNKIAEQEGSYEKAIEICRSINVLADDENVSIDIEKIIEPVIQDLLNRIKTKLDESKVKYERMYLNGLINLFINIDMLFEQFFGITTEKLKPYFLKADETSLNIAEIVETNEAISLALEGIEKKYSKVNFLVRSESKSSFSSIFKKKISVKTMSRNSSFGSGLSVDKDKIESGLLIANIAAATVLVGYVGFSSVYSMEMDKFGKKLANDIAALSILNKDASSDKDYVQAEADKYRSYNEYISDSLEKIREGKIGKYSTYNVANFMQKVAKYIPTNVVLQSISSDDNKSVTIVASSTSYAELGYFISQLKLQGILENIKTGKVETGNTITVTIGGDLP